MIQEIGRRRDISDWGEVSSAIQTCFRTTSSLNANIHWLYAVVQIQETHLLKESHTLQTGSHTGFQPDFPSKIPRFLYSARPPFNNSFLTWPVKWIKEMIFWANWEENPDAECSPSDCSLTSTYWISQGVQRRAQQKKKKKKPTKFFKVPTAELSSHRSKCQRCGPDLHISKRFGNSFFHFYLHAWSALEYWNNLESYIVCNSSINLSAETCSPAGN